MAALDFEREVQELVRELGRVVIEYAYNRLEPKQPEALPHSIRHAGGD